MNIFKKIFYWLFHINTSDSKYKPNNILICPICGSTGYIYHKMYSGYGAKCPNCSFSVEPVYKFAEGPIIIWERSCKQIKEISNNKQKEKIKNNIIWTTQFPEIEGNYIIKLPNGGLILKYIGIINTDWCDVYGPINRYDQGTLFYGPIPNPDN